MGSPGMSGQAGGQHGVLPAPLLGWAAVEAGLVSVFLKYQMVGEKNNSPK